MGLRLTARHRRILTALAQGDLLWEVPGRPYFAQYNERTGKQARVRLDVLETMERFGWIRRVSQEPAAHKLDFWEIVPGGRDLIAHPPEGRKQPPALTQTIAGSH